MHGLKTLQTKQNRIHSPSARHLIFVSFFAELVVMVGLEAARILNNLTDQKVNVSATVTLHCDAAGRPTPLVLWTKNNQTVVEGSGEAGGLLSKNKTNKTEVKP